MFFSREIDNSKKMMLSDHSPARLRTSEGVNTLMWNMLCPAEHVVDFGYYNNGFGCEKETPLQYQSRLVQVAGQLSRYSDGIDVIALQEAPETDELRGLFIEHLKAGLPTYQLSSFYDETKGIYLMLFHNTERFELCPDLTCRMQQLELHEGLNKRSLPVVLLNKENSKQYLFVNVHADYSKTVLADIELMLNLAISLGIDHIQWLGDFNRALCNTAKEYDDDTSHKDIANFTEHHDGSKFSIGEAPQSSFCYKKNTRILETRDGHISSKALGEVSLEVLVDMNTPLPGSRTVDLNQDFLLEKSFIDSLGLVKDRELEERPAL